MLIYSDILKLLLIWFLIGYTGACSMKNEPVWELSQKLHSPEYEHLMDQGRELVYG